MFFFIFFIIFLMLNLPKFAFHMRSYRAQSTVIDTDLEARLHRAHLVGTIVGDQMRSTGDIQYARSYHL